MSHYKKDLAIQIGNRLERIQSELNYDNKDMALGLGITPHAYCTYKRGEVLAGTETCIRMIEVFHANPGYLLTGDSSKGYVLSEEEYYKEDDLERIRINIDNILEIGVTLSEEEKMETLQYLFFTVAKMIK